MKFWKQSQLTSEYAEKEKMRNEKNSWYKQDTNNKISHQKLF